MGWDGGWDEPRFAQEILRACRLRSSLLFDPLHVRTGGHRMDSRSVTSHHHLHIETGRVVRKTIVRTNRTIVLQSKGTYTTVAADAYACLIIEQGEKNEA